MAASLSIITLSSHCHRDSAAVFNKMMRVYFLISMILMARSSEGESINNFSTSGVTGMPSNCLVTSHNKNNHFLGFFFVGY